MRPATIDDVPALHELIAAIESADQLPLRTAVHEVREIFESPDTDPDLDVRVIEADGRLVAWGHSDHRPSGVRLERAFVPGGVHPNHREQGHGRTILDWQIARAKEQLATTPPELHAYVMSEAYVSEERRIHLAERTGFTQARFNDELQRSLTDLPEIPTLDGHEIRPWASADAEPTRHVHNSAFADHWGSAPKSTESWAHLLQGHGSRLDLSFVATDIETRELVAYSLNDHYPDDTPISGRSDGWIGSLGTLRNHRKRGIASALIVASLHAFAAEGFEGAMLGVDTENPSGAYGIYEGLGFRPLYRNVILRLTVRE